MSTTELREHTLASGMTIHCDSRANAKILDDEIFDRDLYSLHGIEFSDGDCILDVGANIGFFLMLLNQSLSKGTVFCLEPVPKTFNLLRANAKRHNRLDIELLNCGLSDQAGEATFTHYPLTSVISTMCPPNSAQFRHESRQFVLDEIRQRNVVLKTMVRWTPAWLWYPTTETIRRFFQRSEQVNCQLQTLSGVIEEHGIEKIDLLKIDTEGAEHQILAGMQPHHWPMVRQLIVEVHDGPRGLNSVVQQLAKLGFSVSTEQLFEGVDRLHVVYATRRPHGQ